MERRVRRKLHELHHTPRNSHETSTFIYLFIFFYLIHRLSFIFIILLIFIYLFLLKSLCSLGFGLFIARYNLQSIRKSNDCATLPFFLDTPRSERASGRRCWRRTAALLVRLCGWGGCVRIRNHPLTLLSTLYSCRGGVGGYTSIDSSCEYIRVRLGCPFGATKEAHSDGGVAGLVHSLHGRCCEYCWIRVKGFPHDKLLSDFKSGFASVLELSI